VHRTKQEMSLSVLMPQDEPPNYNQIFENLVVSQEENSPERLIGMLAYAEYKLDKHEWMSSHPNASLSEKAAFLSHYSERVLGKYYTEAEYILYRYGEGYADGVVEARIEKLKDEGISKDLKSIEARLTTEIKATQISYMKAVLQGLVASAIFTFLLFILALMIRFAAPNSGIGQIIQYLVAPENYVLRVTEKNKNTP
jgi:hypothetical protein